MMKYTSYRLVPFQLQIDSFQSNQGSKKNHQRFLSSKRKQNKIIIIIT